MTVSTAIRKAGPFTGNGVTTVFPFSFRMFSTADLVAVAAVSGVETTLIQNVDYTAVLNINQDASPGGQLTTTAPLASGAKLVITSNLPATQLTVVTNGGGFFPAVFNSVFDRLTILVQQVIETNSRNLTFALTDDTSGYGPLPLLGARNGKVLQFNAVTGKPEAGPSTGDITAAVAAAQGYATAASGSANNAATALADTIVARDQTFAAFDNFDDRYLGAKTTAPALDNDGNPIVGGALYFNTGAVTPADKGMWFNDGTGLAGWFPAYTNSSLYVLKAGDTMSGPLYAPVNFAPIATLASAATTSIGAASANTVSVTGTTTITSFGVVASGVEREVIFTGALTLTSSANLILPTGASIVTVAGDALTAVSKGAGVWQVTKYQRSNGSPLIAPGVNIARNAQTGAGYTVVSGDLGRLIDVSNAANQTLALTAAASLGNGWFAYVKNTGAGTWTIDPSSAETVNGLPTLAVYPNEACVLLCDGAAFYTVWMNREGEVYARYQLASGSGAPVVAGIGAFFAAPINTLVYNSADASLASNQITLGPGKWNIRASVQLRGTGASQIRIRNITDAATLGVGSGTNADSTVATVVSGRACGQLTSTVAKAVSVEYYVANVGSNLGATVGSGEPEVYVEFWAKRIG